MRHGTPGGPSRSIEPRPTLPERRTPTPRNYHKRLSAPAGWARSACAVRSFPRRRGSAKSQFGRSERLRHGSLRLRPRPPPAFDVRQTATPTTLRTTMPNAATRRTGGSIASSRSALNSTRISSSAPRWRPQNHDPEHARDYSGRLPSGRHYCGSGLLVVRHDWNDG
jgi:hypothetical protein